MRMDNKDNIEHIDKKKSATASTLHSTDTATLTCDNQALIIADCSQKATKEQIAMSNGFIKLNRSRAIEDLIINHPLAFALLSLIALRATRYDCAITGLKANQAKITANDSISPRCYRTAKQKLIDCGFATVKTTNKYTIATLCNTDIYDLNNDLQDSQVDKRKTVKRQSKPATQYIDKKKEQRNTYGLYVCLSDSEYQILCDKHTKALVDTIIEDINDHCESTGKKYTGFAATIRNWIKRRDNQVIKPTAKQDSERDNQIWASQFNRDGDGWSVNADKDAWRAASHYDQTKTAWVGYKDRAFKQLVENNLRKWGLWTTSAT